jgi:dienelactone hydrolase
MTGGNTCVAAVLAIAVLLAVRMAGVPAQAQQRVTFASVGDGRNGKPDPAVDGYLYRPTGTGAHPALVLLHGCAGLIGASGHLMPRETDWAQRMTSLGYVVLAVDSFTTRHQGKECAPNAPHAVNVWFDRVHDAYAALGYLHRQSFVRPDRIGVIGWSQGGMTVLNLLNDAANFGFVGQQGFRAAVAFYPAGCDADRWSQPGSQRLNWSTSVPLLVLFGGSDTWVSAAACENFVTAAKRQGAPVGIQIYPDAVHDFDWPNLPRRELPNYTPIGRTVAPIVATNPAARADAIDRVTRFLNANLQ